jgi:hypothetical protein
MEVVMSAVELDDRRDPSSLLYYAPRQPRRARQQRVATGESSILPILEKLRRTEGARPFVEPVPLIPSDEPVGTPDAAAAHKRALLIAARFAAVTGLCIGAAVIVAFSLQEPQSEEQTPRREDRAALPAAQLPTPVQTVTFKAQARHGDETAAVAAAPPPAAETRSEPWRESAQNVIGGGQLENTAALPAPLTSWAAAPMALSSAGWSAAGQNSVDKAEPAAQFNALERAMEPEHPVHHTASSRRSHHARRRHRVATAAAQPKHPAEQTDAQANAAPPPVDNSLRSVLHKIFRPD